MKCEPLICQFCDIYQGMWIYAVTCRADCIRLLAGRGMNICHEIWSLSTVVEPHTVCSKWYSDSLLWLSVYRNWDSTTVGIVTVCCDCRCTGTETAELSVQWWSAVTVGVEALRQQNFRYSDGVLWLSVYRNWDSRTVGTVTVCCDCTCTETERAERSVQWRCVVTGGVQELRQQNCRYSDGVLWLSV
jgi:hypothetical protein